MNLADDPRWRRFNDRAFHCPCCGKSFNGIFDLVLDHPDQWPHGYFQGNNRHAVEVGDDFLSSDLCILGTDFFVRGLVELPILGTETRFAFNVWSTLHKDNFTAYENAYGTEEELKIGPCFGWLSNNLPLYGTDSFLRTEVNFRGDGQRPRFAVWDENSRLGRDQETGITFDQLLDIYAACGTDIRPHLMDG